MEIILIITLKHQYYIILIKFNILIYIYVLRFIITSLSIESLDQVK